LGQNGLGGMPNNPLGGATGGGAAGIIGNLINNANDKEQNPPKQPPQNQPQPTPMNQQDVPVVNSNGTGSRVTDKNSIIESF
jgi:hypothetical protein